MTHETTTAPEPRETAETTATGETEGPAAASPRLRRFDPRGLPDDGMATAEYAIATLAACGFAGLLVTILKSGGVRELLLGIVQRALSLG